LYAWGINQQGQIGDGNINVGGNHFDSFTPKLINSSGYIKVECGVLHSLALK
jgi:alpha-tubulin suppressor-like RCC1 family protein